MPIGADNLGKTGQSGAAAQPMGHHLMSGSGWLVFIFLPSFVAIAFERRGFAPRRRRFSRIVVRVAGSWRGVR